MPQPLRLSQKQALILDLLLREGYSYGLELVRASDGHLKRGSVYVTLDRMESKGLVESWEEESPDGHRGPARRKYKPTGLGQASHANWLERAVASFGGLRLAGVMLLATPLSIAEVMTMLGSVTYVAIPLLLLALALAKVWRGLFDLQKGDFDEEMRAFFGDRHAKTAESRREMENLMERIRAHYKDKAAESRRQDSMSTGSPFFDVVLALAARFVVALERRSARASVRPPGHFVMSIFSFVFPRKWVDRRFAQAYADELVEHAEDLAAGRLWRARWVGVRIVLRLLLIAATSLPAGLWDHILGEFKSAFRSAD